MTTHVRKVVRGFDCVSSQSRKHKKKERKKKEETWRRGMLLSFLCVPFPGEIEQSEAKSSGAFLKWINAPAARG